MPPTSKNVPAAFLRARFLGAIRIVTANRRLDGLTWPQIAPRKKGLANRKTREDHNAATGRRFTFRAPPPFSSRLSRDTVPSPGVQRWVLIGKTLSPPAIPSSSGNMHGLYRRHSSERDGRNGRRFAVAAAFLARSSMTSLARVSPKPSPRRGPWTLGPLLPQDDQDVSSNGRLGTS